MNTKEEKNILKNLKEIKNRKEDIYKEQRAKREAILAENPLKTEAVKHSLDVAELLYRLRKKAGLTQGEVAKRLRMKQPNIARIEKGQNITIETMEQYAAVCGATINFKVCYQHR